jgi:protein TonB
VSEEPAVRSSDVASTVTPAPQPPAIAQPSEPAPVATSSPDTLAGGADAGPGSEPGSRLKPGADGGAGESSAAVSGGTPDGADPAPGEASRGASAGGLGAGDGHGARGEGPAAGQGNAGQYSGYLATFRRRIQEALLYPLAARRRSLSGIVQLEVVIAPTGAVGHVAVHASSSHPLLDEAAVETVRRLPALPFPAGVPPRTLTVRIPVVFRLE